MYRFKPTNNIQNWNEEKCVLLSAHMERIVAHQGQHKEQIVA
jgi:hypothetical protein